MNGSDFYTMVTTLLNNFQMNTTLFYQLLNTARIKREMSRPFKRLEKFNPNNIVQPVSVAPLIPNQSQAFTIPSDFLFFREDGYLTLSDNNNTWQTYFEIPQNLAVMNLQVSNTFYFDHGGNKFYLNGIIDRLYTMYMYYQANWGDITANTSWLNIPSIFHPILAYDVAAMYRLGVNYDDINARNADSNAQQADLLFNAMAIWDDNLQRSAVTRLDYPSALQSPGFTNRKIDMNGGGA